MMTFSAKKEKRVKTPVSIRLDDPISRAMIQSIPPGQAEEIRRRREGAESDRAYNVELLGVPTDFGEVVRRMQGQVDYLSQKKAEALVEERLGAIRQIVFDLGDNVADMIQGVHSAIDNAVVAARKTIEDQPHGQA